MGRRSLARSFEGMAGAPHPWHAIDGEEALAALGSGPGGLTAGEADARLERWGANRIAVERPEPALLFLWRQLANPLIVVLIAAGAVALALGEGADGAVVLAVVVANSLIGFAQEWRAGRAIQALAALVPEQATVVRDGARASLLAEQVVPGDVVHLRPGERVPADSRVLAARGSRRSPSKRRSPTARRSRTAARSSPAEPRRRSSSPPASAPSSAGSPS